MVGASPRNLSILGIVRMAKLSVTISAILGTPTALLMYQRAFFVLIVAPDVFDAIGFKAGNGMLED